MDLSTLGHLPWTNLALANQAHIQSDLLAVLRHIQALRLEATCLFEFCGQAFKDSEEISVFAICGIWMASWPAQHDKIEQQKNGTTNTQIASEHEILSISTLA
jgi:hypothetical protein